MARHTGLGKFGMPSEAPEQSLEKVIDSYPLLADLHIHLLGSGDVSFWREQILLSPDKRIEKSVLKQAGLQFSKPNFWRGIRLGDLATQESALRLVLEMSEPRPGEFQIAFSPLFVLRDFVAKNDPSVLTRLILWNTHRYLASGVHYVEMSLGAGWFEGVYLDAILDGITRAEKEHSVLVRLLIAFNREKISQRIHSPEYLRELSRKGDQKLVHIREPAHYTRHLTGLSQVKQILTRKGVLKKFIVGFDIVGNEENHPYTPFLLPEVLDFASEMRRTNPNFGFRLHLGEGVSSDNAIGYVSLRLGEHYVSELSKTHRFRVRCGHGLGIWGLGDSAFERWKNLYPIMRGPASRRVQENLRIAPVEINLTSNHYLMKGFPSDPRDERPLRDHPMKVLLRNNFKLVLGTDDPGVFPNVTLRGEFQKAFSNGLISEVGTFRSIVEESVRSSFADSSTIKQLSTIVSGRYPGVTVPEEKCALPEDTAIEEPFFSDRGLKGRKQAEFERAMRAAKEGDSWLIEDWFNRYDPP